MLAGKPKVEVGTGGGRVRREEEESLGDILWCRRVPRGGEERGEEEFLLAKLSPYVLLLPQLRRFSLHGVRGEEKESDGSHSP
eukprot:762044-Hanusia_phi.AAC.1